MKSNYVYHVYPTCVVGIALSEQKTEDRGGNRGDWLGLSGLSVHDTLVQKDLSSSGHNEDMFHTATRILLTNHH